MEIIKGIDLRARLNIESLREAVSRHAAYVWIGLFILALSAFMVITNAIIVKSDSRLAQRESELRGFYEMASEYKRDMASIGHLREKLLRQGGNNSVGAVIEEIGAGIGLSKKITSFKPLADGLVNGYMERGVQVEIEGVTLNQAVNLLYKIKGYKNLLLIRDFSMKNHFRNPDKLDIVLQVVLITTPAGT